jgi:hypothetical protein
MDIVPDGPVSVLFESSSDEEKAPSPEEELYEPTDLPETLYMPPSGRDDLEEVLANEPEPEEEELFEPEFDS